VESHTIILGGILQDVLFEFWHCFEPVHFKTKPAYLFFHHWDNSLSQVSWHDYTDMPAL
jgi:hypothetical protein